MIRDRRPINEEIQRAKGDAMAVLIVDILIGSVGIVLIVLGVWWGTTR